MVNQKKSKCQLRLEARASRQPTAAAAASSHATTSAEQLAAQMHSRIARATEVRVSKQRARETSARERVLHAQQVAREQHAKRRDQRAHVFLASRRKVEVAHERRRAQLEETQQSLKTRVALVREKVQSVKKARQRRSERTLSLLQQQLSEAERRREEQTQRMVRRLSERWQSVESVKDRVARAKFIQRWYRRHVDARKTAGSLRAVAGHVARVVQCWQQIAAKNFEQSMQLLQDRELARAALSVLRVLLPSAANQSPGTRGGDSPKSGGASFRVLLMAGMIAFHPGEIMESGQCDRLAFAARAMHKDMLRIYVLLASGTARELKTCVARLEAHFCFYFESFSRWKNRDAERLAAEMLRSYHDIYVMKQRYVATQTAHEGDGVHQLVFQTEKQLNQLKSALAQVLGRDDAAARVEAVERSVEQQDEQMGSEQSESDDDERQASEASPVTRSAETEDATHDHQSVPPAQFESFLSDEKLVHELIMNPEFRVPPQSDDDGAGGASSLAARIRDTMIKAFWDQVVAANDIATLLARAEELRAQFATVVAMRPELVGSVNHALDSSTLQALMQNPTANFGQIKERCVRVVHTILQAEAPARNEATQAFLRAFEASVAALQAADASAPELSAVRVLVDFLAFALKKVEDIRVDLVNVHMGMLGAYLQRHGVEYEQKKLHEKLSSGARFEMTHRWLASEFKSYWASLELDEKDRMARYDSLAFSKFLRHSVMALVTAYIEGSSSVWPESFRMDVDRIRGYRDAMDRITIISSLLVVVQDYIARRRVAAPRDFLRRVGQQLSELLVSAGISGAHLVDQAVEEVRQLEAQRTSDVMEYNEELRALSQRLQGAFGSANPVFNLFAGRVASSLLSGQFCEASEEIQVHPSLAPFDAEVRALAQAIKRLAKHNESVHASLYNTIVKELMAANAAN